jgi:hypothetical protein
MGRPEDRTAPEPELATTPGAGQLLVRTWSDGEALLVRQLLSSYGIPCQVVSDVPHAVLPLSVDGLGEIRILVPATRLADAREILADHLRNGLELLAGGLSETDASDEPGDAPPVSEPRSGS